jgi:hypothetical protein
MTSPVSSATSATRAALLGAWTLTDWQCWRDDAYYSHPMGENARGQVIYSAAGRMSGFLMRDDFGGPEPRLAGNTTSLAYGGTFFLQGDEVIHEVLLSTVPEWLGTRLHRRIVWQEGKLLLVTPARVDSGGHQFVNRLLWEKLPAMAGLSDEAKD